MSPDRDNEPLQAKILLQAIRELIDTDPKFREKLAELLGTIHTYHNLPPLFDLETAAVMVPTTLSKVRYWLKHLDPDKGAQRLYMSTTMPGAPPTPKKRLISAHQIQGMRDHYLRTGHGGRTKNRPEGIQSRRRKEVVNG